MGASPKPGWYQVEVHLLIRAVSKVAPWITTDNGRAIGCDRVANSCPTSRRGSESRCARGRMAQPPSQACNRSRRHRGWRRAQASPRFAAIAVKRVDPAR